MVSNILLERKHISVGEEKSNRISMVIILAGKGTMFESDLNRDQIRMSEDLLCHVQFSHDELPFALCISCTQT